jgi:hypothetical protein
VSKFFTICYNLSEIMAWYCFFMVHIFDVVALYITLLHLLEQMVLLHVMSCPL